MRILYASSSSIGVPLLSGLAQAGLVVGVLTQPDKPSGRGNQVLFSPVKEAALRLNFPVLQPSVLDQSFRDAASALKADLLVVFSYGKIFGPKALGLFPLGGINVHPSSLPQYRGPSPINAAILNRDSEIGISIQTLSLKMDCGDLLLSQQFPLKGDETGESLTAFAAQQAVPITLGVLERFDFFYKNRLPQGDEGVSYTSILTKEDGWIDWNRTTVEIEAMVRGLRPWPLASTTFKSQNLLILESSVYRGTLSFENEDNFKPGRVLGMDKRFGFLVKTGDGILAVSKLQLQSKKALSHLDFNNGVRDFIYSELGGNHS